MGAIAAGTTVGQYEVLAKLKSGGMATLYLARRVSAAGFKRHVAIKVVHEHLAEDSAFVRMFVDEALLQARIHHPNVVHVEELGHEDGQHFLVMEYVHGCSLAALMGALARKDRRLVPEVAAQIAVQVAAGLHAAHELRDEHGQPLGVVHRDVTPQNVLLAYDGHVKLIDFGVAKAKNRDSTVGGSLKGKLRYMAPEQAMSRRGVDRRVDVYALGILLWEMLTHRRCFSADDDIQLLDMIRDPKIAPPSTIAPQVSPALDAVVMKALAKLPEDRYQSAHEMRRALAAAIPEAMLVDATQIAELLTAAMAGEIEREKSRLPESVSGVIANQQRREAMATRGDEALHTMTLSGAGLSYLQDASDGPPSGSGVRSQGSASLPPALASVPPSLVAPPIRTPESTVSLPAKSGNGGMIALGVGVAVVAAILVALGVALAVRSGSDDMVATPLVAPGEVAAEPGGSEAVPPPQGGGGTAGDPGAAAVAEPEPETETEPEQVAEPVAETEPATPTETASATGTPTATEAPTRTDAPTRTEPAAARDSARSAPATDTGSRPPRPRPPRRARPDGPPMADEF